MTLCENREEYCGKVKIHYPQPGVPIYQPPQKTEETQLRDKRYPLRYLLLIRQSDKATQLVEEDTLLPVATKRTFPIPGGYIVTPVEAIGVHVIEDEIKLVEDF